MKIKTNQSGIAHVAVIIFVLVIVCIGFLGWKVWDNIHDQRSSKYTLNSKQETNLNTSVKRTDAILNTFVSYKLPEGWSSINCSQGGSIALLVPDEVDTSCNSSSYPQNEMSPDAASMGVVLENPNFIDPQSCANTLIKRDGSNDTFSANEYSCTDITVDGKKGIREVGTHTSQSFIVNGVPSTTITYTFSVIPTNDLLVNVLRVIYTHYPNSSYTDQTASFDNFVNSLTFK